MHSGFSWKHASPIWASTLDCFLWKIPSRSKANRGDSQGWPAGQERIPTELESHSVVYTYMICIYMHVPLFLDWAAIQSWLPPCPFWVGGSGPVLIQPAVTSIYNITVPLRSTQIDIYARSSLFGLSRHPILVATLPTSELPRLGHPQLLFRRCLLRGNSFLLWSLPQPYLLIQLTGDFCQSWNDFEAYLLQVNFYPLRRVESVEPFLAQVVCLLILFSRNPLETEVGFEWSKLISELHQNQADRKLRGQEFVHHKCVGRIVGEATDREPAVCSSPSCLSILRQLSLQGALQPQSSETVHPSGTAKGIPYG